jgi:DNA-binding XRE family transcriptional regulator
MESLHMTQQVFADFIGIAPATLSGIFTERTKPTINTVEAIKNKLPSLSTDWLMFGKEPMYIDRLTSQLENAAPVSASELQSGSSSVEPLLDFQNPVSSTPQGFSKPAAVQSGIRNVRMESGFENMNNFDKIPRKVTEIRVFYDDQTWESFVPAKK